MWHLFITEQVTVTVFLCNALLSTIKLQFNQIKCIISSDVNNYLEPDQFPYSHI